MSTIKDIAREAGVSIATVSIVLNGKGKERKISTETQLRIQHIARKLSYVPNQSAKKLRAAAQDSYAIAFYWATDFRINYLARITLGIQKEIMQQSKVVHLTVVPYKVDNLQKQVETTQNEFFNGIIIANMSNKDMEYLESADIPCPVVLFNRESPKYSSVTMDNYTIGKNVGSHFLAKGIYDAGVFTHGTAFPIMRQWMQGFLDAFADAGHPIPEENVWLCGTDVASAIEKTKEIYAVRALPKAMFCVSDVLAHGMLYACHELGISIPGDTEVFTIGVNMTEVNDYSIPSLSRIDIPMGTIGENCLNLLVDLIEKKETSPAVRYIDGIKIVAQSSPAI